MQSKPSALPQFPVELTSPGATDPMPLLTTTIERLAEARLRAAPGLVRGCDNETDSNDPTRGWAEAMAALGDEAEEILVRGVREAIGD